MTENIKTRTQEFCAAHGLHFACSADNTWVTVGQSGFWVEDIDRDDDLLSILSECKHEHEHIEGVQWEDGLLYKALHRVGDDPVKSAIEAELASLLDEATLNKIARVFYKHTREC